MWRITAAAALTAIMGVALLSMQTPSVYACSVGPDFDPVAQAELIVSGRLTSWELTEVRPPRSFQAIRVHMQVDRVYRGPPGLTQLSFVDAASLIPPELSAGPDRWAGSSGSCGTFNFDPAGKYAVMGLSVLADGEYRSSGPLTFFLGDEPNGDAYEQALERMASWPGAAGLPALGTGSDFSTSTSRVVLIAVGIGAALLLASLSIRYIATKKT